MLDFLLVLGQIPGTNLQITFNELVIGAALAAIWYFRRYIMRSVRTRAAKLAGTWHDRYWRRRQLSLPV